MTAVRPVLPTDLAALVGSGRVYPNEAVTLDRGDTDSPPRPLEAAFEQWLSFATGKHTWISVRGATLRGLVSARRRGAKAAWELDCLIDAAEDDSGVLMSLLDRVASDAGEAGAEKIFIRVAADSDVIGTARRCGFVPYSTELILQRRRAADIHQLAEGRRPLVVGLGLRRWVREDAYPTFQLYNRWTPESVRRSEAATFSEWQAAREKIGPRARQWVVDRDDRVAGWLRAAATGEVGRFELMADPSEPALVDALLEAALIRLHGQPQLSCRVYDFAGGLRARLEEQGFAAGREFALLAKQVTQRARQPQLSTVALA